MINKDKSRIDDKGRRVYIKRNGQTKENDNKEINDNRYNKNNISKNNISIYKEKDTIQNLPNDENMNNAAITKKKEKEKEIKNRYVSDGTKFGKKENIIKNKIAQRIPIDVKEKEPEITNDDNSYKPKGLYNLGLSSYMNSLLQCLYYVQELRDYFIKNKNKFTDEKPTCKAFAEVMYGLKFDKKDYFEANEFKKIMESKNALFSGFKAGDAKDLYFNLIDSFLNELTKEKNEKNSNEEKVVDLTKKLESFKVSNDDIDNNIINYLFIGHYETAYKCQNFKNIYTYSFNPDTYILFDLEKISKYDENKNLSIYDCFEYNYQRNNKTSFFCDKCKQEENNNAEEIIFIPPKILVLILDRGHGKKYRGKVEFTKDLDLRDLIDKDFKGYKGNSKYKLIGVSTHSGSSSSSGHCTACCLADDKKYYYFSDTFVSEVNKKTLYENEPYLLFYKRLDI